MPWFRHHYYCEGCDGTWLGEAALVVEDDCPFCGAHDTAPYRSDDWTFIVEPSGDAFVVLESTAKGERDCDYTKRKSFATRVQAEAFRAALAAFARNDAPARGVRNAQRHTAPPQRQRRSA